MSRSYLARIFAEPLLDPDPGRWFPADWGMEPNSLANVTVSPDTADRLAAVFACVRVISETAAMLPLLMYRRLAAGGKERAPDHPVARVLRKPNPWQTPFEFLELYLGHTVLRGEGFAQKVRNSAGDLIQLIPLHPARLTTMVNPSDGQFFYRYQPLSNGPARDFRPDDLMRTLAFSRDGIRGRSPITVCREAIGTGLAGEQFGASFLGKGASPSGFLKTPGVLKPGVRDRLQKDIEARSGSAQAGKTYILEDGLDWVQSGMKLVDAQFIELRKFSVTEIARIFRVPPHKIMDLERSTNNNIEHQGLEFTTDCEMPWLRRLEQTISRDLLDADEQDEFFAEFLVDALARGDLQSRYQAYAVARQWGWLNADEIREMENKNPLPDGQGTTYLTPLNMVPADQLNPSPSNNGNGNGKPKKEGTRERVQALLREPLHRLARREAQMLRAAHKRGALATAYDGHLDVMVQTLLPVALPCAALLGDDVDPLVIQTLVAHFAAHHVRQAVERLRPMELESYLGDFEDKWPGAAASSLTSALEQAASGARALLPA